MQQKDTDMIGIKNENTIKYIQETPMAKSTDICIVETESTTEFFPYRSPAKFG